MGGGSSVSIVSATSASTCRFSSKRSMIIESTATSGTQASFPGFAPVYQTGSSATRLTLAYVSDLAACPTGGSRTVPTVTHGNLKMPPDLRLARQRRTESTTGAHNGSHARPWRAQVTCRDQWVLARAGSLHREDQLEVPERIRAMSVPERAENSGHQRSLTDTANGLRSAHVQVDPLRETYF